eukprot:COSAG01_NODE_4090_length_5360_cov_26.230184_2_plen_447_part_00
MQRITHPPPEVGWSFGWTVPYGLPCGSQQVAYRLKILNSSGAAVLDTGRVPGTSAVNVVPKFPAAAVAMLQPGRHYSWAVKVWLTSQHGGGDEACVSESAWSEWAGCRTTLWDGFGISDTLYPIRHPHAKQYSLFRKDFDVIAFVKSATCYVTALGSGPRQQLLGAYRLYISGASVSIGPGRGECSLLYRRDENLCLEYDTVDVTAHILAAGAGSSNLRFAVGLQSFHDTGAGGVLLRMHLETSSGDVIVLGTNSSWLSYDATDYFGPSADTIEPPQRYNAPRENQDARAYPGRWQLPGFTPPQRSPAAANWTASEPAPTGPAPPPPPKCSWHRQCKESNCAAHPTQRCPSPPPVPSFAATLRAKVALPLAIETGQAIPFLTKVNDDSGFPLYFFDQESEEQGGIHLELPSSVGERFQFVELTLSEELAGAYGTGQLLYPMAVVTV